MEALLCKKLGDPTLLPPNSSENSPLVLTTSHPIPELNSPTAVRVRVRATSLNYANYLQILGKYQEKPPLPFIPGSDYSGIVESIGPNVSKFKIGDPVCSFAALGTFAQFIVADETELFRVPDGCDLVAAGALPVAYGTSHVALVHRARLSSGQVLLVLGAAGGVGLSAVQIGKVCGATVIAVARGAEKAQFLKSLGVDHVIDLSRTNVTESVKGFLKTRKLKGVDLLYDPVGGKLTKETMKLLNWGAQILVIGFASGEVPVIPANIALVKNETVVKTLAAELDKAGLSVRIVTMQILPIVRPASNLSFPTPCVGGTNIGTGQFMDSTGEATRYIDQANLAFSVMKDRKVVGKVMITLDDHKNVRSKL